MKNQNQLVINDAKIYLIIRLVIQPYYTLYLIDTLKLYYYQISPSMRRILICLESVMVIRLVCDVMIVVLSHVYGFANADQRVATLYSMLNDGMYIENRLCIIILYRFLQLLNYAKTTINKDYTSVEQIIKIMRINRIFTILIILINIGAVLSQTIASFV